MNDGGRSLNRYQVYYFDIHLFWYWNPYSFSLDYDFFYYSHEKIMAILFKFSRHGSKDFLAGFIEKFAFTVLFPRKVRF